MEADEGKRVRLQFICCYEDGTIYEYADRDVSEFIDEFFTDDDPGDLMEPDELTVLPTGENPETGLDLFFDVEMISVEDVDMELGDDVFDLER